MASIRSIISYKVTALDYPAAVAYFIFYYFCGTLFFDILHYLLHKCAKSRIRLLRQISKIHSVHHWYFDRNLRYNDKYRFANALTNLPLELCCQLAGSWLSGKALLSFIQENQQWLATMVLRITLIIEVIRVIVVVVLEGRDSNHIPFQTVPKDKAWFLVGPEYHALHHMYPDQFMSSLFRLFDWAAGTSSTLKNSRIAMTGANGAFGTALRKQLERDGVKSIEALQYKVDWDEKSLSPDAIRILENTDVLILAHGARHGDVMQANYESTKRLIKAFAQSYKPLPGRRPRRLPEIWYTGSEAELHPSWGIPDLQAYSASKRRFLPLAKSLYDSDSVLYRHIVLAAFSSKMGPAVVSADWAARWTMWWIRRGAKYVPVTYTGMAYLHFFKFLFWVRPEANAVDFEGGGECLVSEKPSL